VQVKNKHEMSMLVWPPRCGETSGLGLRDSVAAETKCRPHGGKNSKTKSGVVHWLSHKAKTKSGRLWQPSHYWDSCGDQNH
jgi:hypothetical protein